LPDVVPLDAAEPYFGSRRWMETPPGLDAPVRCYEIGSCFDDRCGHYETTGVCSDEAIANRPVCRII
jgi:hypothetical protein